LFFLLFFVANEKERITFVKIKTNEKMAITATNSGGSSYEPIPAGTYLARCYSMVQIGTVKEEFQGLEKQVNKVRITWELPTELKVFNPEKGEQPQAISKEFTLSMHEKSSLRAFLTSWRGKGFTEDEAKEFDVTKLLGVPCMLSIVHEPGKKDPSRIYDKIASVSTVMKGVIMPPQINPSFEFTLENFDQNKFDFLPDFLKDKIRQSKEYKTMISPEIRHMEEIKNKIENFGPAAQEEDEMLF
jgi:hypothetical protein